MIHKYFMPCLLVCFFILGSELSFGADSFFNENSKGDLYDLPIPEPIMLKKYNLKSEFGIHGGWFPMNSFSKYFSYGLSQTWFFSESSGWEVINVQGFSEVRQALKRDLLNPDTGYTHVDGKPIIENDFPNFQTLITTNFIFSPFYTKNLLFNKKLIYSQMGLVLGGGVAKFTTDLIPAYDFGLILKFFMTKNQTLNFDVRELSFVTDKQTIRGNINMQATYAWGL